MIIGGGVLGAACARALAARGTQVTLIDRRQPGAATDAAAGMLAPLAEAGPDDPLLAFSVRARDLYTELVPELEQETGIAIGLWSQGIYQVAFAETDVERLHAAVAWQRQRGFSAEWLPADELRERLPGIGPDALGAALAPEDGALDPTALTQALTASASAKGARIIDGTAIERVVIEEGRVTEIAADNVAFAGGSVVVAAGCWSRQLDGLPRPVSVEPIRGQMVALEWPRDEPRAIVFGGGGYVLERAGEAVAGSTMEHVGFDPSVTEEGINHVLGAVTRIYPALTRATETRQWAGLRPSTPDGRPILGRDPEISNLWYATGHGRNGILLAALSGEILARMYHDEEVEYDLEPMDPSRFWTTT